jgi:hypothetical protein
MLQEDLQVNEQSNWCFGSRADRALEKIAPVMMEMMGTLLLVFVISVCAR